MTSVIQCACFLTSKQTPMPTARPPACLPPSHPATATSPTTARTSSPSRGARLPPSTPSWTDPTGRGRPLALIPHRAESCEPAPYLTWQLTDECRPRQKVCCGIVYKGRFGEVIIDPRLFKPCCSSKKQKTLASTQVAAHLPSTLPAQLPEDVKPNWWLLFFSPNHCRVKPLAPA